MRAPTVVALVMLLAASASAQITDLGIYYEPPLPALPAAGGTFVDPTFGTTILRVTDAETDAGASCGTAYSYWPTFNATSTRLWAFCDDSNRGVLFDFAASSLALSNPRPLFASPTPSGGFPILEDAIWSPLDPDVVLAHDQKRLWSYDVVTETYTLVKDFSALHPSLGLWQMSVSADADVFGFTKRQAGSSAVLGYVAWVRSSDTLPVDRDTTQLDEVQIDKSGRYLLVKTGQSGANGVIQNRVFDLTTGQVENLTDGAPDFALGHSDNGHGIAIGADDWNNQLTGRSLATPHSFSTILAYGDDWTQDQHVSLLADDERWLTVTSKRSASFPPAWGPFHGEVYQVATDGSQRLRRLAHHRSEGDDYFVSPRGNISRDGRFIAFTSDWGGSPRHDLFVVVAPATGMCGDGVVDLGESCDDHDLQDGDGCDHNCTPTGCGNGVPTAGEDCDDGNAAGGDCCSPTCGFESSGAACADGNPCTQADHCDGAGVCGGAPEPLAGCAVSSAGRLQLKAGRSPSLAWQWSKGEAARADFGNPVDGSTSYTLCVYDQNAGVSAVRMRLRLPAAGMCRGKPCWKPKGTSGLGYKDADATPDGVTSGTFKAGAAGKASIQIKARGPALTLPPLPFVQQPAVTAQLQNDDGACWTTTFAAPATRNDGQQLKDRF